MKVTQVLWRNEKKLFFFLSSELKSMCEMSKEWTIWQTFLSFFTQFPCSTMQTQHKTHNKQCANRKVVVLSKLNRFNSAEMEKKKSERERERQEGSETWLEYFESRRGCRDASRLCDQ